MSLSTTLSMVHSKTLRFFTRSLINFTEFLSIIIWTFYSSLYLFMALEPCACVLHLATDVGSSSVAFSSFWILTIKDWPTFMKWAISVSFWSAFKIMITVCLFIYWVVFDVIYLKSIIKEIDLKHIRAFWDVPKDWYIIHLKYICLGVGMAVWIWRFTLLLVGSEFHFTIWHL